MHARLARSVVAVTLAAALTAPLLSGGSGVAFPESARRATVRSAAALRLHDRMRTLWEEHVWWTRSVIVSFAYSVPDLGATVHRLLRNQNQIGNLFARYYGDDRGDHLALLLRRHIKWAAAILSDVKADNQPAFDRHLRAWYVNANKIARFLHRCNPANWPLHALRMMMHRHLDLTLTEATSYLAGKFPKSIRNFQRVEKEILMMADTLTRGIIAQFPGRF